MEINEIKAKARESVDNIFTQISVIETCEALLPVLEPDAGSEVTVLSNNVTVDMSKALSDEQRAQLLADIHTMVKQNIMEAGENLMLLSGMKKEHSHIVNTECEATFEIEENVGQNDPKEQEDIKETKEFPEMNLEDISRMHDEGMTYTEIAKHYGYKDGKSVRRFLEKHKSAEQKNVESKKAEPKTEMKAPEEAAAELSAELIRKEYTNGKATVSELSKKLGVTKKELYKFIADKHLERTVF